MLVQTLEEASKQHSPFFLSFCFHLKRRTASPVRFLGHEWLPEYTKASESAIHDLLLTKVLHFCLPAILVLAKLPARQKVKRDSGILAATNSLIHL